MTMSRFKLGIVPCRFIFALALVMRNIVDFLGECIDFCVSRYVSGRWNNADAGIGPSLIPGPS